jgi:hypothetical protein
MGEMGRREHGGGSHLREGTASVVRPNFRSGAALRRWGWSEKQRGGGFYPWGASKVEWRRGKELRRGGVGRRPFEAEASEAGEGWGVRARPREGGRRRGVGSALIAPHGGRRGGLVGSNANRGARPVGAGGGHPCMAAHVRAGDEGRGVRSGWPVAGPLPWPTQTHSADSDLNKDFLNRINFKRSKVGLMLL